MNLPEVRVSSLGVFQKIREDWPAVDPVELLAKISFTLRTGGQGRGRTADLPLSGASAGSLHVAGRGPIGDLAAKPRLVVALWGLTPAGIGSPFGSPTSLAPLTIGSLGRLTDRRAPGRPSPGGRPGQHADLIASRPTAPKGPVHLAADLGVSTHERQHPFRRSPAAWPIATGLPDMHGKPPAHG